MINLAALSTNGDFTSGATPGNDFIATAKSVRFLGATRETVKTCPIDIINDLAVEGEEFFVVDISNNNVQIDPEHSQSKIIIEDDDGKTDGCVCVWGGWV